VNEICPSCYGLGTVGEACRICGKISSGVSVQVERLAKDLRRKEAAEEAASGRRTHWRVVAAANRGDPIRFECEVCGTVVRTRTSPKTKLGRPGARVFTGIQPDACPHCYLPTAEHAERRPAPRVIRHRGRHR